MYVYHLRAENPGLHPNLTRIHGDRGCGNTIPGDVAETRGFASSMPKAKKKIKRLPRATHCTDRAQTSGNVTTTVTLCPPHLTFRVKVRARRRVPEKEKKRTIHVYIFGSSNRFRQCGHQGELRPVFRMGFRDGIFVVYGVSYHG